LNPFQIFHPGPSSMLHAANPGVEGGKIVNHLKPRGKIRPISI
jgi:hypothetical protein